MEAKNAKLPQHLKHVIELVEPEESVKVKTKSKE